MIHFLSATPGSGKSLLATELLYKLSKDNIKNLKHNFYYAKAFFEKIKELKFDSYLRSLVVTRGQGLERETELVFFEDDFFNFLKTEFHINVVMTEYSDLEINFPEYYFERITLLNLIIESLNENEKTTFEDFKVVRTIYTNIADLRLSQARPLPRDCDWRLTPQGSYFVIDEAQLIPIFSEEARTIDPIVKELTIHRHKGYDFLFITQDPSFVNKYIRKLASYHIHLINIFGWEQSMKIEWTVVQENPNAVRSLARAENVSRWMFPKHVYKLYKSSTIHTRKKRIPKKLVFLIILAGFFFLCAGLLFSKDSALMRFFSGESPLELTVENKDAKQHSTKSNQSTSGQSSPLSTNAASEAQAKNATTDIASSSEPSVSTDATNQAVQPVYDPSKPFDYKPVVVANPVNHRRFSGCVKWEKKYFAYDQQGTLIGEFSAKDCANILKNSGNRPFDYFGERNQAPATPADPTTDENYKKAYLENLARIEAERYAKSKTASVQEEQIPIGTKPPQDISGANSL